eukprot:NODE_9432_length_1424_cov_9.314572.p1 GENE.NODE_9432_length_1424_cov_9.314572~~NODE_9432_length_1424_cov_9.314572.p1  ORF type:complete len:290 (-),score=43.77 NODE_9432_length_1424_cov_9.314572:245-1114(-)
MSGLFFCIGSPPPTQDGDRRGLMEVIPCCSGLPWRRTMEVSGEAVSDAVIDEAPIGDDDDYGGLMLDGRVKPRLEANEVVVNITRKSGCPLGLELDLVDGETLFVVAVRNDHAPGMQPGDRIIEVRHVGDVAGDMPAGVRRGAAGLLRLLLLDESDLAVVVQRPTEACISLNVTGTQLGIEVRHVVGGFNLVIASLGIGAVRDWNTRNPEVEVCCFDRIISVNGQSGLSTALVSALTGMDRVDIGLLRYGAPPKVRPMPLPPAPADAGELEPGPQQARAGRAASCVNRV